MKPPRKRGSLHERFWRFVVPEPNSGCWLWDGSIDTKGYGQMRDEKRRIRIATHVSLEIDGRPLPAGMCACHHCDNPGCVNPGHLFIATRKGNTQDMIAKGRQSFPPTMRGTANPITKINPEIVADIRASMARGEVKRRIAERYGLSPSTINDIRRGKSWSHV